MSLKSLGSDTNTIVKIGIILAIGLAVLGAFKTSGSMTAAGNTAIDNFVTALGTIGTWGTIIVLIIVAAIVYKKSSAAMG